MPTDPTPPIDREVEGRSSSLSEPQPSKRVWPVPTLRERIEEAKVSAAMLRITEDSARSPFNLNESDAVLTRLEIAETQLAEARAEIERLGKQLEFRLLVDEEKTDMHHEAMAVSVPVHDWQRAYNAWLKSAAEVQEARTKLEAVREWAEENAALNPWRRYTDEEGNADAGYVVANHHRNECAAEVAALLDTPPPAAPSEDAS